jgi:hypothetical protein
MKRKLLPSIAIILFSSLSLSAQIEKNDIILGANLGIYYNNSNGTGFNTTSNANISPRISLAVGTNSVIGLKASLYSMVSKADDRDEKNKSTSYGIGLFWKKYMLIKNHIGWYTELNGGATFSNATQYINSSKYKNTSTAYGLGAIPGIYYQVTPKILLSADAGGINFSQSFYKTESQADSRNTTLSINFLNSFSFGVDFILGKKA